MAGIDLEVAADSRQHYVGRGHPRLNLIRHRKTEQVHHRIHPKRTRRNSKLKQKEHDDNFSCKQ
jgi:hypothetical protein